MKNFWLKLKNEYLKRKVLYNCILLGLFCTLSMITEVFSWLAMILIVALIIASNEQEGLYYLAFIMPFYNVVRLFGSRFFYIPFIAGYVGIHLLKRLIKKELKFNKTLFILFWILLAYMFLPIGKYNQEKFMMLGQIALLILTVFLFSSAKNKINFLNVVYMAVISTAIASVAGTFAHLTPLGSKYVSEFNGRFAALYSNVNDLSRCNAFLMAMLTVALIKEPKKLVPALMLFVTIAIGLLSISKSFMILVFVDAVIIGIWLIVVLRKNEKYKKFILPSLAVMGVVAIIGITLFMARSEWGKDLSISSILTNRDKIWIKGAKAVGKSWFSLIFGLGMSSVILTPGNKSCHSTYLELFQRMGIVGFGLLVAFLVVSLVIAVKKYGFKKNLAGYIPLLFMVLYGLTETIMYPTPSLLILPLCLMFISYCPKANECNTKINESVKNVSEVSSADAEYEPTVGENNEALTK